jgi:ribonuclease P/MRP protein subunit POP1
MPPKHAERPQPAGALPSRPGEKSKKRQAEAPLAASPTKKSKTLPGGGNARSQGNNAGRANHGAGSGPGGQKPTQAKKQQDTRNGQGQSGGHFQQDSRNPNKGLSLRDIRAVAAQPSDAALNDGELDVQAFLNARGFEIRALDESMKRTRAFKTSRAFQKVPFTMRRRAAAHNHKKVPKRLHKRAKKEMLIDNTPTVNSKTRKPKTARSRLRAETALRLGKLADRKRRQKLLKKVKDGKLDQATVTTRLARPKIKRNALNDPVITAKKFKGRQRDKTWLPTHLWHTKRAKMTEPQEPLWRFAIPLTPSQKCYRPTHRAQWEKGAMAWDMSYTSTIRLCGTLASVGHVLKSLGLAAESFWNKNGEMWRSGSAHWSGSLSRTQDSLTRTIGPATIFWDPIQPRESSDEDHEGRVTRQLFIRVHPSIFLETFNELLRLAKGLTPRPYVEDLRFEIGSIDITGPDSTEALLGILKPYHQISDAKEPHASKFESLAGLSGPNSLPLGSLLAFSVMDPRLRYPPRRLDASTLRTTHPPLAQVIAGWHKRDAPSPMDLFDRDIRHKATVLPSQKSLNRRRSKNAPGSLLQPTQADPKIPIILLASRQPNTIGTWTLLMPWKCILPTWYGLMHYPLSSGGNPSFGGLNEIQQLAFEQGVPWFPGDVPATDAGMSWELAQRAARKKAWDRMPRGKRVNYETLDLGADRKGEVGKGWICDYELLWKHQAQTGTDETDVEMVDGENEGAQQDLKEPGLPDKSPLGLPLSHMRQLSKPVLDSYLSANTGSIPPAAVVSVKITLLGRGVPQPCARVYGLPSPKTNMVVSQTEVPATDPPPTKGKAVPSNLRDQWLATLPRKGKVGSTKQVLKHNSVANLDLDTRKRLLARELTAPYKSQRGNEGINGHPLCPDADDLMGFITTGSFNLRNGVPEAIATISAEKALEELAAHKDRHDPAARVCVVRNAGQNIGWLGKWELV